MNKPLYKMLDFDAFETYAHALVQSLDADPVYHLVPKIIEAEGFEATWFVFVYTAFYSLESAVLFCRRFPTRQTYNRRAHIDWPDAPRKFGAERRGTSRVVQLQAEAFETYVQPKVQAELAAMATGADQLQMRQWLEQLPLVGGWAAFKLTELFEKALGHPNLAPLNMGLADRDPNSSRGPQGGCRMLYTLDASVRFPKCISREWEELGVTLSERWGYDLGLVETALCKWAKVRKGQYFIGHDIYEFTHLRGLWSLPAYTRIMLRSGFDPRFWAQPIDVPKQRRMFRDRKLLLNDDFAGRRVVPRRG